MGAAPPLHRGSQHRTGLPGIEARTCVSALAFPRHTHDQYGIGVMVAGGHSSWSNIGAVAVGPGDGMMVSPGEVHDGLPVGGAPRAWHMIFWDPAVVRADLAADGLTAEVVLAPSGRDRALARAVHAAFEAIADPAGGDAADRVAIVLARAVRLHRLDGTRRPALPPPAAIGRARAKIDDAPADGATLADLAAEAGIGRFALLRGFARGLGTTPGRYRTTRRLALARVALARGESPAAAALAAGFADQSHLTRAFRRQFGVTPARYRAALRD